MDERIILLSKKKLCLLTAGACLFVVAGYSMLLQRPEDPTFMPPGLGYVSVIRAVGGIGIALSGFLGLAFVRKFFDSRPGLVLSALGLTDNSSGVSGGFVAWSDISGIHQVQIGSQRFLAIQLIDARSFIAKCHPAKSFLMRLNMKLVGTPFTISTNTLNIKFDDLEQLCLLYWKQYRAPGLGYQHSPRD